jgi:hypothetical protein
MLREKDRKYNIKIFEYEMDKKKKKLNPVLREFRFIFSFDRNIFAEKSMTEKYDPFNSKNTTSPTENIYRATSMIAPIPIPVRIRIYLCW